MHWVNRISMAVAGGLKCVKYLMFVSNVFFWVGVLYILLRLLVVCVGEKQLGILPQLV